MGDSLRYDLKLTPLQDKTMRHYIRQRALLVGTAKDRQESQYRFEPTAADRARLRRRVEELRSLPQAEQGTPDWYSYRRGTLVDGRMTGGRLTASDTGTVLGMNEYGCEEEVILKKNGEGTFKGNEACDHGSKYEDVTLEIYRARNNNVRVYEFGCIPDTKNPMLAASPDGVREDAIAVEIKNPYSKFRKISGVPKPAYYAQMQQQLAVLDLERCDFVETRILEYAGGRRYREDCRDGEEDEPWTARGGEKGVLIEINEGAGDGGRVSFRYVYAPLGIRPSETDQWVDKTLDGLGDLDRFRGVMVRYWRCEEYCCTPVYRDRAWWEAQLPRLRDFWKRVEASRDDPKILELARAAEKKFREAKEAKFKRGSPTKKASGGKAPTRHIRLSLSSGSQVESTDTANRDFLFR